jgi:hypothetical protein
MASFVAGRTKCAICHEIIRDDDEFVATLPIPVTGPNDKFWVFHESFMHRHCFDLHPLKYELRDYLRSFPGLDHPGYLLFFEYLDELLEQNDDPK